MRLLIERLSQALDCIIRSVVFGITHDSAAAPRSEPLVRQDREFERGPLPGLGFHPDPSTLALDNLLTESKADTRAGNFASMQTFEHAEHSVSVLWTDADSV